MPVFYNRILSLSTAWYKNRQKNPFDPKNSSASSGKGKKQLEKID
jgi:hypothetical protein